MLSHAHVLRSEYFKMCALLRVQLVKTSILDCHSRHPKLDLQITSCRIGQVESGGVQEQRCDDDLVYFMLAVHMICDPPLREQLTAQSTEQRTKKTARRRVLGQSSARNSRTWVQGSRLPEKITKGLASFSVILGSAHHSRIQIVKLVHRSSN